MATTHCISWRSLLALAAVLSVLLVAVVSVVAAADGDSEQFTSHVGFSPPSDAVSGRGSSRSLPAGVQVAVHNVVEVNGREFGNSDGSRDERSRPPLHHRRYFQRSAAPFPVGLRLDGARDGVSANDDADDGSDSDDRGLDDYTDGAARMQRVGVGADEAAILRRLVSSTVGSAAPFSDSQQQQQQQQQQQRQSLVAPALLPPAIPSQPLVGSPSVPLTLVDERGRTVVRGVFQPLPRTTASQSAAASPLVGGAAAAVSGGGLVVGGGQQAGALDQLVDLITARLAQRLPTRNGGGAGGGGGGSGLVGAANANAALSPSGGVEIALTDSAGNVVGSGTYFPHGPARAQQARAALGLSQPPVQQQQQQQSQQQQLQPPSAAAAGQFNSQQRSPAVTAPSSSAAAPVTARPANGAASTATSTRRPAAVQCYDNMYDSAYCQHLRPRNGKAANTRLLRRLSDTQLIPATSPVFTTGDEAVIQRSRLYGNAPPPRMVVIEPQRTILYSQADITQSLAPSLGVFPPVAPFMARPQSAAAAVQKQALEAAEAAAPAEAAEEEEGGGVEGVAAAEEVEAAEAGLAAGPLAPAREGTEFRNQA